MTFPAVIRDATTGDAEEVVRILNPIIAAGSYTVLEEPLTVAGERQYIESFPQAGVFLVAERADGSGRLAGFANVEPFASYTSVLAHVGVVGTYVDLAMLRRGVGSALAVDLEERARTAGFTKFFTYIRADNPGSLAFYQASGFTIVGTASKQARVHGRFVDEVIMEKLL